MYQARKVVTLEEDKITEDLTEKVIERKPRTFLKGLLSGIIIGCLVVTGLAQMTKYLNYKTDGIYGQVTGQRVSSDTALDDETLLKMQELNGYIDLYYYQDMDPEILKNGMLHGMVNGLGDKYCGYYTKEEYDAYKVKSTKTFAGIGSTISIDEKTGLPCIAKVNENSPSKEVGLMAGDLFVEVDGVDVTSFTVDEVVSRVRGKEGTIVHLKMYRDGENGYLEFDIKRAIIDLPTVSHEMLKDDIGYIAISDFGLNTDRFFIEAVEDLNTQGMQKLIVDVRANPGGMVSAVTSILDYMLPEGVVVYTEDKYHNRKDYTSDAEHFMMCKIAVLIDANSASASEILAGAVRDFNYGKLIGEKTFGKGIVQTIYDLKDGDAIKLTTSSYYTPNGENIHGKGIEPDIEVEYKYDGDPKEPYDTMKDAQVIKAIEVLESEE